jgi:HD-like signal output (HDOD) protein
MNFDEPQITGEHILRRLQRAVAPRGDFPVSGKVVKEVVKMIELPTTTAAALNEVIRRDPTLSARILDIVNSPFYLRSEPIGDLPQAIVKLGMSPLGKIVGSLILLQKFVPQARQQGPFANSLSISLTLSTLHDQIHALRCRYYQEPSEIDPLHGMLAGIGPLLFSFYFPELYEAARERARTKRVTLSEAIHAISGLSTCEMSLKVVSSLNLPERYSQLIARSGEILADWSFDQSADTALNRSARVLALSLLFAELVHESADYERLVGVMSQMQKYTDLTPAQFEQAIHELPDLYWQTCTRLELAATPLPSMLKTIAFSSSYATASPELNNPLADLREAVYSGDTLISIIGSALDFLIGSLKFDRAVFLTPDPAQGELTGSLAVGELDNFVVKHCVRQLDRLSDKALDKIAFKKQELTFRGEPLFEDGWPIVAFPVGRGDQIVGIIYADMKESRQCDLSGQDHATITMMVELLEKAVGSQKEGLL